MEAHTLAKTAQDYWNTNRHTQTCDALVKLTNLNTPSSPESSLDTACETLRHVRAWINLQKNKNNPQTTKKEEEESKLKQLIDEGVSNICDTYYEPPAIDKFFLSIEKEDVLGTIHCEAYLASLLDNCTQHIDIDTNLVDIQVLEEMKVGSFHFLAIRSSLCCLYRVMDE